MVLVDGNNVMGSRPDGWWRNRAQAAQRLVAEIGPVARSHGGAWTVVFDGPEPAGMVPPHECLTVVHTGHGRRDGADDRIVELVGAIPDPATALVYTSDAGLRARVHVLGARVAGARALLEEIATVGTRWSERSRGGVLAPAQDAGDSGSVRGACAELLGKRKGDEFGIEPRTRRDGDALPSRPRTLQRPCRATWIQDRLLYIDDFTWRGSDESRFFYAQEIARPEDVIPHLAKQELHWKKGYSAYELAHSWVNADDIPPSVRSVLDSCPDYAGAHLVEGLFERDVDLRTPGRRSQTDLLAFVNLAHDNAVIAVEGKVDEPFGELVSIWNDHRPGKERRLEALCVSLGLRVADVGDIRYQLLHRTASAIY